MMTVVQRVKRYIPGPVKEAVQSVRRVPRLLTAGDRMLPAYVVIGSMRSGTSSLYYCLTDHPRVLPAMRKQARFFDVHWEQGERWYRSNFPLRSRARRVERGTDGPVITGEASPEYIFHPLVPNRIKQMLPEARLIVLVRNPVDRAWSHYHHISRIGEEDLAWEDAFAAEAGRLEGEREAVKGGRQSLCVEMHQHGYVAQGHYAELLEPWYETFDPEQILVLRSEDLFEAPASVLEQVFDFIGLPPAELDWTNWNPGSYREMPERLREKLTEHFAPHNRRLGEMLGRDMGWDD